MGDEFLSGLVMRGQIASSLELDDSGNRTFRLLLTSERTGPIPPPDDDGANCRLTGELLEAIATVAEGLVSPVQELQQAWQPVAGDGEWEWVAPSLVVGWLLGHVGGLQFLQALGLSAAAVDLAADELQRDVVLSFFRVSEANGVAHLLGGPYDSGWLVRQVLNQQPVLSTLGSADATGELILYTQEPLRLLNAYVEENRRAFYPSTYRLTLPVLSLASLQRVAEPLNTVCRRLAASWSTLINAFGTASPDAHMTPGQWLRFYSYCLGEMTSLWLEQQLLPPVVPFEPNRRGGLFGWRKAQSEQQPPCGLCFWRDVDTLWELGRTMA